MLSTLITSKTRLKLLTYVLTHPDERFYYKHLVDRLKLSPTALHSDLKQFERSGLLKSEKVANILFYFVNKHFYLYPELKSIIFKTVGLADHIRGSIAEIGNIKVAFIYGSVAKNVEDSRSDIDLMVIGDIDIDKLHKAVSKSEDALGREVNYTVYDSKDWRQRLNKKESFVSDVMNNPKIFLIGTENELREITPKQNN